MDRRSAIDKTEAWVQKELGGDSSGHDWWHVDRVRRLALRLANEEGGDAFVVELAALLHDIADWKLTGGDPAEGGRVSTRWLRSLGVDAAIVAHVAQIVSSLSFKGAGVATAMDTVEGKIVQDADRLDAIGAIGIARAFSFGGSRGRTMFDPDRRVELHATFDEYRQATGSTIHHFHEKLLLLSSRMNTATAKRLAAPRHAFLEEFLARFESEWNGSG